MLRLFRCLRGFFDTGFVALRRREDGCLGSRGEDALLARRHDDSGSSDGALERLRSSLLIYRESGQ